MKGIAWVTGAGKGIGRELSLALARDGWEVAATSRTLSDLSMLVDDTSTLAGLAKAYPGDVREAEIVNKIIGDIERDLGLPNLVILNAGTYIPLNLDNFSSTKFCEQLDINVMGTINCLSPIMMKMKKRKSGYIVVVSSLSAYCGLPYASAYGASKAALTNMCEALKPELDRVNIGLSIVHPGFVRTPLTMKNDFYMPFLIDASVAAQRILKGIKNKHFEITFPKRLAFSLRLLRYLPYPIFFAVTRRFLKK